MPLDSSTCEEVFAGYGKLRSLDFPPARGCLQVCKCVQTNKIKGFLHHKCVHNRVRKCVRGGSRRRLTTETPRDGENRGIFNHGWIADKIGTMDEEEDPRRLGKKIGR